MLRSGWYQFLLSGFGDGKPSEVVEEAVVQDQTTFKEKSPF